MTTRPRRSPGLVSRLDLPFRAGCRATPEVLMPALEETTVETPDLGIYGQTEVLTAGGIPTWDNPDIVTNDWRPFRLRQEASVTVRNFSTTTSPAKASVPLPYASLWDRGQAGDIRLKDGPGDPFAAVEELFKSIDLKELTVKRP